MALQSERVVITADAVADICNQVATLRALIDQLLEFNSDQAIDWAAAVKPTYIDEQVNGNMSGKQFSRQNVANAIGSLDNIRKLLMNQATIQGDHLGNLNLLVRPLG